MSQENRFHRGNRLTLECPDLAHKVLCEGLRMGLWGPPSGLSLCPRGGAHVAPVAGRPAWVCAYATRLRCVLGAEAFVLTWGPLFFSFHFGLYSVNPLSHTYSRLYRVCNKGEGVAMSAQVAMMPGWQVSALSALSPWLPGNRASRCGTWAS